MRIAIYHNLSRGGALFQLEEIAKTLINRKFIVDLYSLNNNAKIKNLNKNIIVTTKKTKNIFQNLIQAIFEIPSINFKIANLINSNDYDLILVFPCLICQSPSILKHIINKNKLFYFFAESKREFYENTSFDHYSPKKILGRILRLPIKWNDISNCKFAKNIITNSTYSSSKLKNIYSKNSFVIYPGLSQTSTNFLNIKNSKKIITIGLLTKIKGYKFSISQLKGIFNSLDIVGRKTNEFQFIVDFALKNRVTLEIYENINNYNKYVQLKNNCIFLANQINEPFGISTLEASNTNLYVLGLNSGGTPEIIQHGLNGCLYPNNLVIARSILQYFKKKNNIKMYKTSKIDWNENVNKLLFIYQNFSQ